MTTKTKRHSVNPFLEDMIIPIGSKSVKIMPLGSNDNVLVNQTTGEQAGTHVVARKRIDKEKFVKTFADYMAFTFELTKAGNKVLRVLMWALQQGTPDKDTVIMDRITHESFVETHKDLEPPLVLSYTTFTRGISELEKAKIIAKHLRVGMYYINPSCLFNGDRIAFTTILERSGDVTTKELT